MILGNVAITAGTGFGNLNDPNYNNVGLLLTGAGGTNGATNNTFLDSSPYGQTVTRNGDVTQGSFTPYLGYYGAYFDGSGDYLSINYSSGSTIAGDFTWETWAWDTGATAFGTLLGWRTGSPWQGFLIQRNNNNNLSVNINQSGGLTITQTSNTYLTNQWNHVALVRSGSTVTLYVNGTSAGSGTYSGSFNPGTSYWIGSDPLNNIATTQIQGYISNQRFVNGTAVYTSNFTPSTTPLTAIANTTLLTCQSNRFIDNSPNNFAITRNGNVTVTHFNPFTWNGGPYTTTFNGGSMYFDGSGDYLTAASNATTTLTANFTIEFWVYRPASGNNFFFTLGDSFTSTGIEVYIGSTGSALIVYSNGANRISSATLPAVGTWSHVAVVRAGTTVTLYLNGSSLGTWTSSATFSGTTYIGAEFYNGSVTGVCTGYISNVRLVNGTAVYTAAFTPPTQPLQPVPNTVLLLNGTNAGIVDRSENNNLVTVGNTSLSTAQTRFNPTSIFFDGTGDYLTTIDNPAWSLLTSNFTIEFWYNPTSIAANHILVQQGADVNNRWILYWSTTTGMSFDVASASSTIIACRQGATTGWTAGTWYYVTLVRNGNVFTIYRNGVSIATLTDTDSIPDFSGLLYVGGGNLSGDTSLNGYIDDLRITPGVARYTSNFTPPTYSPLGF